MSKDEEYESDDVSSYNQKHMSLSNIVVKKYA